MKKLIPLLLAVVLTIACNNKENSTDSVNEKTAIAKASFASTERAELTISGMTCAVGCAGTIQKNLAKVEGVQSVEVDFDNRLAMVEFNPSKIALSDLENTVHNTADSYKVVVAKKVDNFTKATNKKCTDDCTKDCCKDSMNQANAANSCQENCAKKCCSDRL